MKKRIFSIVLAAAMMVSLVACGKKADNNSASNAGTGSDATTAPTTVNADTTTLNIWMSSEPDHLDPALNSSVDGGCLAVNSFEGLLRYNEKGELEAACAESYTVSEDGKTYVFTLRDGLKWSNGEALTAKDFEYSWKRAAKPEVAADYSYLCAVFKDYSAETGIADDSVKASEDGKTLTVTLKEVCPYFLDLCAFPYFFPVYEKDVEASASAESPAGTWSHEAGFVSNGAFTLEAWNHDSDMTYVKNANYWDAENVTIEKLNVMLTSEDTSAYTAYQAGDLDFIDSIPTEEMQTAMKSSEFVILDNLGTYYAGFNYNSPVYAELGLDEDQAVKFRRAISLLIDRQYIIDTIGQTNQKIATTFIPDGCSDGNGGNFKNKDYYSTNYEENVAEAKKLLAEIGLFDLDADKLTKTVALTYLTNNSAGNVRIAEAIQADLATIGIEMTIDQQEWKTFLNTRKQGQYDFARNGWVMDYNDAINMIEMWTTQSGNNDCQFGRDASKKLDWAKYDALVDASRSETDLAKRAAILHEAEDMLMATECIIPIYYYNDPYMVKNNVTGIYGTVEGMKYFYKAKKN